jgi:hypothetical protein
MEEEGRDENEVLLCFNVIIRKIKRFIYEVEQELKITFHACF